MQLEGEGMVLPFEPMTMTFKDLHYWVSVPREGAKERAHVHMEGSTAWLELLLGISGAFRPKVLTCLMGVTGAGKTTLMDVLAGRKTGMQTRHLHHSMPCFILCLPVQQRGGSDTHMQLRLNLLWVQDQPMHAVLKR